MTHIFGFHIKQTRDIKLHVCMQSAKRSALQSQYRKKRPGTKNKLLMSLRINTDKIKEAIKSRKDTNPFANSSK